MKISNFIFFILAPIISIAQADISQSAIFNKQEFTEWSKDSIEKFLSEKWIHIGAYENHGIIPDTVGWTYSNNIRDTIVVTPEGKFLLHDKIITKQRETPILELNFYEGESFYYETECWGPNFDTCFVTHHSNPLSLIIKNKKFYFENWEISEEVKIMYLNADIITINKSVYIRCSKAKNYNILGE
ncbi:MAG: hypothetical protein ACHQNT_03115 [Bacteroidia bacterium]